MALTGTKSNRSAIGARVTVESGGRRQIDEVMSGGSYYSQNDLALYFGLGQATVVNRLEVRWPSGALQEWKDIPANQRLLITEGASRLGRVVRTR
ncbi:MAG: ASPIC/UnbV domain-containing protein [Acidobacteriia bacterium]|nr:ASPIC/UnbV domain-containing protein [Terriglobia bacterium]